MGMGDKLTKNVKAWGVLAIVIVLMSVVLIKFKTSNVANMTCGTGYTYNASANVCCATGNICNAGNQTAIGSVASTLDTFVAALSEPKNWVAIVIIALIGFGLLSYFKGKKGGN